MLLSEIKQKGRDEGRVSVAIEALKQGLSPDTIVRITKIPQAFLAELKAAPDISLDRALEIYFTDYTADKAI
jgi:hypothetical protein